MNQLNKKYNIVLMLLIFAGLVLISGCSVGPDYSRPVTAAETAEGYHWARRHSQDCGELEKNNDWWKRFGDPVTAELVFEALENNYDLKAAAARVLQASAALAEIRGTQLPQVSYNFMRDRNKRSFNFGGGRFSNLSTTYSQDISVSYVVDLFGRLRRAGRAAEADMFATEASRLALANSLIAGVIDARVQIATTQRLLDIARANTLSRRRTLEIVERRYSQGLVGPVDVRLARENFAAAKALEPAIESTLERAHHALDVLLARAPGSSGHLPRSLPDLPDLESVPVGMPASLLDRRPDLIAAEETLRGASERIGVSIAQLYPDLVLTGTYGRSADRFSDIFESETEIYGAIINITQPIFQGGRLRSQVEGAKARHAEAAANYAAAVLTAMSEVEDALVREEKLQLELGHARTRLTEAAAAENLSQQRYRRGVESILTVLESERRRRIAENELALLKGRIWTARINLFLALGGDWTGGEQIEG